MLQQNNTDPQTQYELLQWYVTTTKQNCCTNNDDTIIQHDSLAMGAPSSGLIAQIFLQYIEHQHLAHLAHTHTHTHTHTHKLINYWRYVDDILIALDSNHTTIQAITQDFNTINYNSQQRLKKTTP
jgi:hypothetical protein